MKATNAIVKNSLYTGYHNHLIAINKLRVLSRTHFGEARDPKKGNAVFGSARLFEFSDAEQL